MKQKGYCILLVCVIVSSCGRQTQDTLVLDLGGKWQFRASDAPGWMQAEVPGVVHLDLLRNDVIEDPFWRDNEQKLQWIDKKSWEYEKSFEVNDLITGKRNIELIFEGLDTYATIYLNDQVVGETSNMFRTYRYDCRNLLVPGTNHVRVLFHSPSLEAEKIYDKSPYAIPAQPNDNAELGGLGNKKVSPFVRKAGYHFGWDWGPRFLTSGIWRPCYIKAWDQANLESIYIVQKSLEEDQATLHIECEIESAITRETGIDIFINHDLSTSETIMLDEGTQKAVIPVSIDHPDLWWPNGLGEQTLYDVEVRLTDGNRVLSSKTERIGLRTIELVTEDDQWGQSFYFRVNGHPVFMKGANYIPSDNFLTRVDEKRYLQAVQYAAEANMNMLRVWGGGIYENDRFYELCDEYGILVWQDFMFACSMYPADDVMIKNIRHEAVDNVKRLRNHPCLALWCGNNEVEVAWKHWGWKNRYDERNWTAYHRIFKETLSAVVNEYDPNRRYWHSSPSSDSDSISPRSIHHGDLHFWSYRKNADTIAVFRDPENIPRFMSETGIQSFSRLSTIKQFSLEQDRNINSPVMKAHQKSRFGNEFIIKYINRHYQPARDFQGTLYLSQLVQAKAMKVAHEAYLNAKPFCMGALYWQLNDCWPTASWSSIDYYGNWKAMHYEMKRIFSDFLITTDLEKDTIRTRLISGILHDKNLRLVAQLSDFDGEVIWNFTSHLPVPAHSNQEIGAFDIQKILKGNDPAGVFLTVRCYDGQELMAENISYLVPEKQLNLRKPEITLNTEKKGDRYVIRLNSNTLVKNVCVSIEDHTGMLEDNYFDLLPGESKEIHTGFMDTKINTDKVKIYHMLDAIRYDDSQ